jgi:hypothetical protein
MTNFPTTISRRTIAGDETGVDFRRDAVRCSREKTTAEATSMSTARFYSKEAGRLIDCIAILAPIQAGLLFPDRPDFVGNWIIMAIFGAAYAVIGSVTGTAIEEQRQRNRQRVMGRRESDDERDAED